MDRSYPDTPSNQSGQPESGASHEEHPLRHHLAETVHRLQPGASATTGIWSPMPERSGPQDERSTEAEARSIARMLNRHGILSVDRLRMLVGARAWGPWRFHHALRFALERRWVRNSGHGTFSPGPRAAEVWEDRDHDRQ